MKEIVINDFVISFDEELQSVIENYISFAIEKKESFCKIFNCNIQDIPQIKVSYFTKKNLFIDYIKELSNGETPPDWATGCFYGGEIQVLINVDDKRSIFMKKYTLPHELCHLFFNKLIYDKFKIKRIVWFDEAFANYLDGKINALSQNDFEMVLSSLTQLPDDFDISLINDLSNANKYNSYNIFLLVGFYIFKTKQEKHLLSLLTENFDEFKQFEKQLIYKLKVFFKKV